MTSRKVKPSTESAPNVVGVTKMRTAMTETQVRLRANKRFQQIVAATTIFAVFCDVLGTAVIVPGLASVCAWAEGGPADNIMTSTLSADEKSAILEQYISPHAFNDPKPSLKFSMAMNLVMSLGFVGSAAGSFFFGRLVDKVGAKTPIMICLFMGIGGYIIIYAAAIWVKSYWWFLFGNVWNNFFGCSMDIALAYFGQLFADDPVARDNYQGGVMGMGLVGGAIGSFIVMPFSNNPQNGVNYFESIWLAIGFTAVAFVLVLFILVPPEEKKKDDKPRPEAATPALAKRILLIAVTASALDSGGDEGTRMARGTILTALFPEWQTPEKQNYLLLGCLVMVILTLVILGILRKKLGLASVAVIGCTATLAVQLLLLIEWEAGPFLAIWYAGKLFGFLSTIASGLIITEIAPKAELGYWNGVNSAASQLSMAVSPLIFATVYDAVGNVRGQEMLACTATVSFLATVAYAPLICLMPKPLPRKKPMELKDLQYYEELSDTEWCALPMEIVDQVTAEMLGKGKVPRVVTWGDYAEERPTLHELQGRALKDFEYVHDSMIRLLSNREMLIQEQQNFAKFMDMMPKTDRDKVKHEMGAWIADYFDDAGYVNWETQCQIYKAMIMTAFPPISPLDNVKPDFATMPVDTFEDNMAKVLKVMDSHLATEQRRVKSLGSGPLTTLIRRR